MTAVYARPAQGRELDPASFARVTSAKVTDVSWAPDGYLKVTFAGTLTDAQTRAVREWMTSASDEDFARRATLRKAAASGAVNLAQMTAAYVLGDPMPAPAPPSTTTTTALKT